MNIWKFLEIQGIEEEKEQTEDKQVSGGGGSTEALTETKEEEEDPLDVLNESIEKNYKEYLKLEKDLSEFDTTLEDIPETIKPTIISNYNKEVKRYNELGVLLQTDIKERDEIDLPVEHKEPTWGNVIYHSLKSGLGQYQASLVNVLRLIQMGGVKATDTITDVFDKDWYNPNKDFLLNSLTKIVKDSEQISITNQEQAQSKNWLKKIVGTGLQAVPQIAGSVALGAGMPIPTGITKPTELTARLTQMLPFGVGGAGGHARNIEQEYKALGKEAPYLKMVIGGALSGGGEMATELPVFIGISKLLKGGGKALINKGAKTLVDKYGKLGLEFLKNVALQSWQEAEMEPIAMGIHQAVGIPQDWSVENVTKRMGEGAYGGFAMAMVLGGLGGGVAGSAKVIEKTEDIVDKAMGGNKQEIKIAIRKIAEMQNLIPKMPEAETLAYEEKKEPTPKVEPKPPKDLEAKREMLRKRGVKEELLTDEFVKKAKITELPKADVTSEQISEGLIEDLEKKWGKEKKLTKKEVLKKVEKPKVEVKAPKELITKDQYDELKKHYQDKEELPPNQMLTSGANYGKIKYQKYEMLTDTLKSQLTDKYNEELKKVKEKVEPKEELKIERKPPVIPTTEKKAEVEKVAPAKHEVKREEIPKVEPKFPKDIKIKDVYTIGETTPTKKVKGKVRKITGQTKQDKVLIAELDILDLVLKGQEKVAKKAFSEGQKKGIFNQKEHFKDIVARAKERKAQKDYVNKLIKDINKLPTEKVHIDYKDEIQDIKDMFDLKKRQQKTLKAREETAKFIEREMKEGNTKLQIPQETIDLIKKTPLNDMTIAQLEDVHNNILHLAHIGKTKGKLLKIQKGRKIEELANDLIAKLNESAYDKASQTKYDLPFDKINQKQKQDLVKDFQKESKRDFKKEIKESEGLKKKVKDIWSHFWVNTTLDEALFERMDGGEKGLWWETFYNVVNQCQNDELIATFEKIEDSQNNISDNKIDIVKHLQERTGDLMLTHSQRVGVYLCSLDEDAKRHIQKKGFPIVKNKELYKFTDKDIENITNSLTKEEKARAKHYQEYQLLQGNELDKFDVRVKGVHLKKVKNRYGIQILNEDLESDEAIEIERNPTTRQAYLEKGFREERTHRAENVIDIDSETNMICDMAKVEHYKAYEEAVVDINNLLTNENLKKAIYNHPKYGRIAYDNIIQWFKDSVKAKQNKMSSSFDKTLMFLRTSAFLSMLGINVISGSKQLVSLCNAVAETNLSTVLSGIEQVALHYNEVKQFVFKRDPQMRARKGQIDKIVREWMESADTKQILTGKPKDIRLKQLFLIRILDEFAVLSVWKGSYDQAINQGKSEKEAIKRAGAVMRKTQPAAAVKDLPQWFRDGTAANLFSLFQNQINKNQNYIRHDMFGKLKAGKIDSKTFAHRVLWGWITPAVLIGTLTRGRPPEDWKEIARDIATYYAGGWFFVGSIVTNIMMGYGGWIPAPLIFGDEFFKAATYKTWESKFKHGISGICKVLGFGFNQPYRTIEGADDWIQGETKDIRRLIWSKYALEQGKKKEVVKKKSTAPKGFGKKTISKPKGFGETPKSKPKGFGD